MTCSESTCPDKYKLHKVTKARSHIYSSRIWMNKEPEMTAFDISFQFSRSVVSDSLRPHGLQHASLPCPSSIPGACSNLCPSSRWWHPTISSSVLPFSSCLQSFPASRSFPITQLFSKGSQGIGAAASASVFPMNIQDWFSLWYNDWISLSPRDSQESSPTPKFKSIDSSALSFLYGPTLIFIHYCIAQGTIVNGNYSNIL